MPTSLVAENSLAFNLICAHRADQIYIMEGVKKMPKIDTLDALEEHEEHDDDYQTVTN